MSETAILIVEDEAIVARDLRQRLTDMGYGVVGTAARGDEAVRKAQELRPDLVLMDIHLADGMDGIEAASLIRKRCGIPVVFLTAYADQATLARAKITEPFGYILKPFEERELQTTIEIGLYRHRAETALRESEARFRNLVDNSTGMIATHDMEGVLLSVNPAGAHALGYEPPELVGHNLCEFLTPAAQTRWPRYLGEIRARGFAEGIMRVLTRQGEERAWLYRNVRLEEGGKPYVQGYAHDITERERAEDKVRRQNVYLTALHETSLGMMRRLDLQELLEAIITHAARLVGTDHGYVFLLEPGESEIEMRVGIGLYSGFVGTRAASGVGLAGSVWQTGAPVVVRDYRTWQGRLPDPSRDVLRAVVGVPLKSADRVTGVIGLAYTDAERQFGPDEVEALGRFAELASLALDNARLYQAAQRELAERKRAEEETRRAEEFLTQIVENIPHTIFVKDARDLRFVRWNRAGEELIGIPRAEMLGKSDYDLYPREQADTFTIRDRQTLDGRRLMDIPEEPIETRRRGRRLLHTKKIPIADADGEPRYLLGISEDITEYRRQEEQRQALEHKLQETQKLESLGVLAGGIAHDFNNLLVSVLGNVGLVLLDLDPSSPVREQIEQIKIAAQRAADLTRQMLAYSGKGKFVMQSVNLNTLIQEMTQLLRVSISKSASLKFRLAADLPAIEADPTQIRQIIMNLIVNASDAIGNRPGVISVTTGYVRADRHYLEQTFMAPELKEGSYVYLEVEDTGCGMDEETKKKIFDPFFTTKFTGRGLGLAAVLGILRGHDGAIKVYSEVGQGSVFRVLLPCRDQAVGAKTDETWVEKQGQGTVLVIDDEDSVRGVTKRILERFGYTTLAAEDGYVGLELLSQHRDEVVCILLDVTMPRLSGEETYREILKIKPDAKVVLMSGYTELEANRRFKGEGLVGFMQKPYTPEELQDKLQAAIKGPA